MTRAVLAAAGFLRPPARTSAPEPRSNPEPEKEPAGLIEKLAETVRLVKSEQPEGSEVKFWSRLEVLSDNSWCPVVSYEIYEDVALRHEFTIDGKRRTIRIDLPPWAVQELAENDVSKNWQSYFDKFLSGKSISDA